MGTISYLRDKLTNVMSGMGTTADRRVYGGYNFLPVTPQQAESAYRSSWLMRKIVDLPALDMTRNWRAWQATRQQIDLLEKTERRLQVQHKFKRALVLSRLWGGGALVMGVQGAGEPEDELNPARVRRGSLSYLHVFSRHQLQTGEVITNPQSPWFGHPSYYQIVASRGQIGIKIHPSRVIALRGQPAPEGSTMQTDLFWGDPIYQSIEDAVKQADTAQDGFSALIDEAKVDVIKIPELMKSIGSSEYETRLMSRLQAAATGKSTWRSLVLDGAEDWQQKQITWAGIPDVIYTYLQIVAGAADIPITRLLGTSPKGLQSTGEGEEKDYHAMVMARQDELLTPGLMWLDEILIRDALGSRPDQIWWKWISLSQLSPKEAAEIEERRARTVQVYATTGLIESEALGKIAENAMIESGQWPGSDEAFEAAREIDDPDDLPENDPEARAELGLPSEADPIEDGYGRKRKRRGGLMTDVKFDDGKVRSLYVHRKVLNADEILAHYRAQGLEDLEPADELHITIVYSTTELDWMLISPDWSSDPLRLPAGGPRQMDLYGPRKDYLVLLLNDDHLEWRHKHMLAKGAVSKWPDYQPHITIGREVATDLDTDAIEPWKGPVVLGPEIFEEIDPDR